MSQDNKCSQCLQQFSLLNLPRSMPLCEHNICTKCLKQAIQQKQDFIDCQFCSKKINKNQIKLFPKNLKLIQKLKSGHASMPSMKVDKKVYPNQNSEKLSSYYKEDDELLIPSQSFILKESQNPTICTLHRKPLEIICATEKMRLCSHCAIFGNHKDHRLKTVKELQDDIRQKTEIFSQILQQKQKIYQKHSLNNLKQNIEDRIEKRKQLLSKQLQNTFDTFIIEIRKLQKSLKADLDQNFEKTRERMTSNLINQVKSRKKYLTWELSCQQIVNKLKFAKNIKNRIEIFYDSPLEISNEGEFFLDQMVNSLMGANREVEDEINAITIKTQDISFDKYVSLVFPILEDNDNYRKEISRIRQSFDKDLSKNFFQSIDDESLKENSFIFDEKDISAIKYQDEPKIKKKILHPRNLNCTLTSSNDLHTTSHLSIFANSQSRQKKIENSRKQTRFNRTQTQKNLLNDSNTGHGYKSPDLNRSMNISKSSLKPKIRKSPEDILIQLSTNDFMNEVDFSEQNLSNQEIFSFLQKAKNIKHLKAIKLEKNNLDDLGLSKICEFLKNISNLNLSSNKLTEKAFEILLKNKQYLYKMRIINLTNNEDIRLNKYNKKTAQNIQELKKLGISIVCGDKLQTFY